VQNFTPVGPRISEISRVEKNIMRKTEVLPKTIVFGRTNKHYMSALLLALYNKVTAIMTSHRRRCTMSHHMHRQTDRQTKNDYLISTNVHYIHLGGDNYFLNCKKTAVQSLTNKATSGYHTRHAGRSQSSRMHCDNSES